MYKRRAGPGSGPRSFKNTHTQLLLSGHVSVDDVGVEGRIVVCVSHRSNPKLLYNVLVYKAAA